MSYFKEILSTCPSKGVSTSMWTVNHLTIFHAFLLTSGNNNGSVLQFQFSTHPSMFKETIAPNARAIPETQILFMDCKLSDSTFYPQKAAMAAQGPVQHQCVFLPSFFKHNLHSWNSLRSRPLIDVHSECMW